VSEKATGGPFLTIRRRPRQAPSDHSRSELADVGARVSGVEHPIPVFAATDLEGPL
jgi:hypothetical protein